MRYVGYMLVLLVALSVDAVAQGFEDRLSSPSTTTTQGPKAGTLPDKTVIVKRGTTWRIKPDCGTAPEQIAYANTLRAENRLRAAYNAYNALVYAWPDSGEAITAQVACAEVAEQRRDYTKAFDEYQYLIDRYVGQFNYGLVLERQFSIANYLMSAKRGKFLFFPGFDASDRAIPLFEKIVLNAPSWEKAPLAQFNLGLIHEKNEDWEEAITAFEVLQNRYENSSWAEAAAFHQATCQYRIYKDRPNDATTCNAARSSLVRFIRAYPNSADVAQARDHLNELNAHVASLAYDKAVFYDRLAKRPAAALLAYQDFVKRYPEAPEAPTARSRIEALRKDASPHETP